MLPDEIFTKDRFAQYLGVRVFDVSEGRAKAEIAVSESHLNAADMVHGGLIFALADIAFAAASNSHDDASAVAVNMNISFLNAGHCKTLTAVAEEISRSRKLATYRIDVTDDCGTHIACLQGTVYRKAIEA